MVFFLFLSFFRFSSDFPFLDVLMSSVKLKGVDIWANVCKLCKNWHNDKLNKSSLTSSNICGSSITHHRDVKTLGFLHVSLVKELVEQEISPLGTDIKRSQWGTDVTSVKSDTRNELFGNLNSLRWWSIDQKLSVIVLGDFKFVKVLLELISKLLHSSHICEKDWLHDPFFDQLDVFSWELSAKEVVLRNV